MNKTFKTLAIDAVFCLPALSGIPQEINETAATETIQAAQTPQAPSFWNLWSIMSLR